MLEVTKFFDEDTEKVHIGNSRILTQFDLTDISSSIVNGDIPTNVEQLNLVSTQLDEVKTGIHIRSISCISELARRKWTVF